MSQRTPVRSRPAVRADRSNARQRWSAELSASVTVFLIALPLSLGIALAAGAPLQSGLVAAAVGGLVCGWLGGAPLQITGPAAGLTVITAELIQEYGWQTTCGITVLAGVAQLGLGFLRVARSALAVSPAVVHGMLAGIGGTIALAQLHVMLGGAPDSSPLTNALELPGRIISVQPAALSVSALTVVVLLAWPLLKERGGPLGAVIGRVPAALAAVGLATLAAVSADARLPRVDLPSWRSHALPELPEGPVLGLGTAVLTLALVASVQALLSAVAADKLAAGRSTGKEGVPRSDLDRELRAHGVANAVSGALGGLPVTGVAVRSAANIAAGATSRNSALLQGVWVLLAAGLLVEVLELIPLAALGALVMVVGVRMISPGRIRTVARHREALVFGTTAVGVVLLGVLEGVGLGIAMAVAVALHRLAGARVFVEHDAGSECAPRPDGGYRVVVRGQLTFLAVPRLSRALAQVPEGARAVVELEGSFMDHAAFEALEDWRAAHTATGGEAEVSSRAGQEIGEPSTAHTCSPWTPWRNHQCTRPPADGTASSHDSPAAGDGAYGDRTHSGGRPMDGAHGGGNPGDSPLSDGTQHGNGTPHGESRPHGNGAPHDNSTPDSGPAAQELGPPNASVSARSRHRAQTQTPTQTQTHTQTRARRGQLLGGVRNFQRTTAPLVRDELARLAREGQRPSQLFLACADSRLVTSMITSSGPGDLFTVRNVGNLVPPPGEESGDQSVAAAIEYAVDVLRVESVTVCGHSGCGAMQALHSGSAAGQGAGEAAAETPLGRWLRHARPTLERLRTAAEATPRLAERETADALEALCLTNVVQQLEHLAAHKCVARRLREGTLELHGMYFDVGEAQTYVLDTAVNGVRGAEPVFAAVRPDPVVS
ncbi:bifunctional SulP family inorganic anion transporter/carbonic anhydrase [Streptomyces oryzae]|uniref:Bifunctional SulP family inorganic anion transporter/carbonic anhydrase n=1 Tax=Streptomyces oryzae TaxID=1434886 RepID=A0ABS3XHC7_9ACTN|nr:bifunctional SulP family inorganic anion transporter/carbonic anhydrase [Streptomyces oryzae]MBO8194755.1 bifunctional SulP family inorganic anion transporter/carbonic anhydrase [Streptomyces oryzae]